MNSLLKAYEHQSYYQAASSLLNKLSKDQVEDWFNHDCAKALLLSLEGTIIETMFLWKDGMFTSQESQYFQQGVIKGLERAIENMKGLVSEEGGLSE